MNNKMNLGKIERLDKIIASQGTLTRSEVKKMIRRGEVCVDGKIVKDSAGKINAINSTILINGKKFEYNKFLYLMLYKPSGILSATKDPSAKTVLDLMGSEFMRPGLFPVGRLDIDTTGLLIITDDGDYAHRIMSPKNNVYKVYHALVSQEITENDIKAFEKGVNLADGTVCKSAKLSFVFDLDKPSLFKDHIFYNSETIDIEKRIVEVRIAEGKYHQVKRMFAACGNNAEKLHRVSIGGLELCKMLRIGGVKQLSLEQAAKGLKNC